MEQRKLKKELCNAERTIIPANKMWKCYTGYTGLSLWWFVVYTMRKMGIEIWMWNSVKFSSRLLNWSTLAWLCVFLCSSGLSLLVSYHWKTTTTEKDLETLYSVGYLSYSFIISAVKNENIQIHQELLGSRSQILRWLMIKHFSEDLCGAWQHTYHCVPWEDFPNPARLSI